MVTTSGLSSGAASCVKNLVNLQYRTEHSALWKSQEALKQQIETLAKEIRNTSLDKLIQRLHAAETQAAKRDTLQSQLSKQQEESESRISKLESEKAERERMNEDYKAEIRELKNKINLLAKQLTGTHSGLFQPEQDIEVEDPIPTPGNAIGQRVDSTPRLNLASPALQSILPSRRAPSQFAQQGETSATQDTQTSLPPQPSPFMATQLSQDMQASPAKPRPTHNPKTPGKRAPKIQIYQAQGQEAAAYVAEGRALMEKLTKRGDKMEFIAKFIKGFVDGKDTQLLIKHLKKKFSSRTDRNGTVEITCNWPDVEEGMRACGLLSGNKNKADNATSLSKRRKVSALDSDDDDNEL